MEKVITTRKGKQSKSTNEVILVNKNVNVEKVLISLRIKYNVTQDVIEQINTASVIIFDNTDSYLKFKNILKNQVGVIVLNSNSKSKNQIQTFISNCFLNPDPFLNKFLNITKFNNDSIRINKNIKFDKNFNDLFYDKSQFNSKSILKCKNEDNKQVYDFLFTSIIDEIKHVFISYDNFNDIWLLKSLFLDSIKYLSNNKIKISPRRYVLVDVDDVFLAKINSSDVFEMIRLQDKLTKNYFNNNNIKFKLNLGFNGGKFNSRNKGDSLLIGTISFSNLVF